MKAETPSINGVFKNSTILRIPFFQRHYVWEEAQWERFANDMDSLIGLKKKYFLGSLIFKNETPTNEEEYYGISEKYTVIDGQQRLTTLSIYLKAIESKLYAEECKILKQNFKSLFYVQDQQNNPILSHSINDRPAYQAVMWGNDLHAYGDKRVVKAFRFFLGKLEKRTQVELKSLWMAVFAHVKFVEIILDDQDDEQQIFDTINSLGVDLTIDELMKNFLYEINDEEAYKNNWKPVFDDKEAREFWGTSDAARSQAATDENKVITNFFYDFVRIKMWDYEEMPGFDRKGFVQKNQIFTTCKAFVENFGTSKQDLANEIIEYAKLYRTYLDKKILNVRIPMISGVERVACIAMAKDSTIIPYILYILRNVDDLTERNKIFGFLETYLVRRMVSLPTSSNKMSTEFYPEQLVAKRVNSYAELYKYIMAIDAEKNMHMPSDEEVAKNIHHTTFNDESTPRLVFYLQETRIKFVPTTGGYNNFVADYIMPKPSKASATNYPPHDDELQEKERGIRTKTIGNFLLLIQPRYPADADKEETEIYKMQKKLKAAVNKTFVDKNAIFCDYINDVVCSNWLKTKRNWSENDIVSRNNGFAATVIPKLWTL